MSKYAGLLQALGIPHSALVSIIVGMLAVSFPLGAYVMYHTDIGDGLNHNIPVSALESFGVSHPIPYVEMGEVFAVIWALYAALFALALVGPGRDAATSIRRWTGGDRPDENYMLQAVSWFSVLVLASAIINAIQQIWGAGITPPEGNGLVQFYAISVAPLLEEPIFRCALVGLPLFVVFAHKSSGVFLCKALWHPARHLHIHDKRVATLIILVAAAIFGVSHILNTWGVDKLAQATISGVILGYVYYRYGLVCSIIIHWASNYFVYAYGNFVAYTGGWDLQVAFEQQFFDMIQVILLAAGAISLISEAVRRLDLSGRV